MTFCQESCTVEAAGTRKNSGTPARSFSFVSWRLTSRIRMWEKINDRNAFLDALSGLIIPTSNPFGTHANINGGDKTVCSDLALFSYS